MIRERIEDLGRVCEKVGNLCEHEIFDWKENHRSKDVEEWFFSLTTEKQEDIIHNLAYNLDYLHDELHDIYAICN